MENELIKVITNEDGRRLVSARELHEFLESKERFSKWFLKMIEYGFEENMDYTPYQMVHPQNKQEMTDYALTIDMAKELSMVSKLPKGKQARKYFIECEKMLSEVITTLTQEQKLQLAIFNAKSKEEAIINSSELDRFRKSQIEEKDKLLLVAGESMNIIENFLSQDNLYSIDLVSKVLAIKELGRNNLWKYLRNNKIIMTDTYTDYKTGKEKQGLKHYEAYAQYVNSQEYFKHRLNNRQIKGNTVSYNIAMFTSKGVQWLIKKLTKDGYIKTKKLEDVISELEKLKEVA